MRNVAGLSYTTSRAFIFPSRGCSWASHSVLAALVDPNLLVHLKAAMLCRSKDAAGEPQWSPPDRAVACVITRSLTRSKPVMGVRQQHHQKWRLHLWCQVDGLEREVAALHYALMRVA